MNHPDRQNGSVPARVKDRSQAIAPSEYDDFVGDPYAATPSNSRKITAKLIGRALKRYWWQALLLWLVGSVGLMIVAYQKIKPTYDAFATVTVNPGEPGLYSEKNRLGDFGEYKETQVKLVTSPNVLNAVLAADPSLLQLPKLRDALDPEAEIRQNVAAMIIPRTSLIQVSMASESADEAARIVNAVVVQYLKQVNDYNDQETENSTKRLRAACDEQKKEVQLKRDNLLSRMRRSDIGAEGALKDRNVINTENYGALSQRLLTLELELSAAESELGGFQSDPTSTPANSAEQEMTGAELKSAFYRIPEVADLRNRLNKAIEKRKEFARVVRNPTSDPTFKTADQTVKTLVDKLDQLWEEHQPALILSRRTAPTTGIEGEQRAAERRVQAIRSQIAQLNQMLESLKITTKSNSTELMELELARTELQSAETTSQLVQKNLSQAEYEAKNPLARVRLEFAARPSNRPNTNNRTKIMAVAPFGMMIAVMALLVVLELHAGRVVDPDDIPGRIHVPVLGIVPPLPQVRPTTGLFSSRDEFRTQRQLDQFVQSLDHLRVALTSGRNAFGRERRCILITSACGSEGKTTLAAQLAERCVNAGLLTLLIDADLRNPTLSRMLDVPSNRGLINILRGEATLEEAMTVIGGAGGFHFLPAGTPKVDPSRLLHGDRLAKVLTQARESFDIVIVDAPPVLPVPDALTIGRWTDGAVLAVRYDTSRFPLVERANRRLASVGVPVIGAVVNGVRIVESTYGSYYPSYAYSNDRAAQTPLDV